MGQLFLATHDGEVLSGAFILTLGKKAWYMWGASTIESRKLNPNELLHWKIIQWLKQKDYEIYDLQGAVGKDVPKNHPKFGIYLFKRGFGGNFVELMDEYDYAPNNQLYSMLVFGEKVKRWLKNRKIR